MISHGEGFVIRHVSGRYYRAELVHFGDRVSYAAGSYAAIYELVRNPFAATLIHSAEHWQRHLDSPEWRDVAGQFEVVPGPGCSCCGQRWGAMWGAGNVWRCEKHRDRNPCAIEGCRRTRAAPMQDDGTPYLANDQTLCSEHWRRFVPPHSPMRRVYHRFFRQAKRHGWTPELRRRFWRIWNRIVDQARSRSEGDIDEAEINRMFGWDE